MASVITLKGVDRAISNLNYQSKKSLKYRLVTAIRQFYEDEDSVETIREIDVDQLAKALWDAQDVPKTAKDIRKSLRRIRYSVNADLKNLYKAGKNPEGIAIGPTNIFVMSDEAKDKALKALLADREGLMGADLAELMGDYEAPEGVARATGLLGEAESPEEIMKEEEIVQAIENLDEGGVIESLEQAAGGEELGEVKLLGDTEEALGEAQEVDTLGEVPAGEAEGEPEEDRTEELAEQRVEEEDLQEISFDLEETQYLSVPEEEKAPGERVEPDASVDKDTERIKESDLTSTAEPDMGSADVKTLRRQAAAKEKSRDFKAALDLYQKILEISPGDQKAEEACLRLSLKLIDKETETP